MQCTYAYARTPAVINYAIRRWMTDRPTDRAGLLRRFQRQPGRRGALEDNERTGNAEGAALLLKRRGRSVRDTRLLPK